MSNWKERIERIKFVGYCLMESRDVGFIKRVKALENENTLVELQKYGEQDEDIYYFIDMKEINTGFFAVYNRLLAFLYFADRYDLKPVIRLEHSFPYAEKQRINDTDNPFEYYFKQPVGISPEKVECMRCVLLCRKENSYLINQLNDSQNGYSKSEQCLKALAEVARKYLKLNDKIDLQMREDFIIPSDEKVLGVHVRGTDFKRNYNGHPVQIQVDEYLKEAEEIYKEGGYQKIFLATDDLSAIRKFQNAFRDNLLIYNDVIRSDGEDTVMHSESKRENHHYLLGYEVLRDMYSLAACDGLVAGLSQVSYAARIQKMSMGSEYTNLRILDNGINYHKKQNCPT